MPNWMRDPDDLCHVLVVCGFTLFPAIGLLLYGLGWFILVLTGHIQLAK